MFTVYFRFAAGDPAGRSRSVLLERLLARAEPRVPVADWRAEALAILAGSDASIAPASAAFAALGGRDVSASASASAPAPLASDGGAADWVFVATPVHWVAGPRGVHMPADGILTLAAGEGASLAADFNRVFGGGGLRLHAGRAGLLLCTVPAAMRAATRAPEDLAGRDVRGFMPEGAGAGALQRLMTEVQMWLHEHAVNRQRAARAAPLISALWLWGGGSTREPLPPVLGWTAGQDPLFASFGDHAHYPGAVGPGVIVAAHGPGSPGWPDTEERWLAPAAADLKAGRIRRLLLSAADRCHEIDARGARRFWRRPRPWWTYVLEASADRGAASS